MQGGSSGARGAGHSGFSRFPAAEAPIQPIRNAAKRLCRPTVATNPRPVFRRPWVRGESGDNDAVDAAICSRITTYDRRPVGVGGRRYQ
jgi:hypothetical protein